MTQADLAAILSAARPRFFSRQACSYPGISRPAFGLTKSRPAKSAGLGTTLKSAISRNSRPNRLMYIATDVDHGELGCFTANALPFSSPEEVKYDDADVGDEK